MKKNYNALSMGALTVFGLLLFEWFNLSSTRVALGSFLPHDLGLAQVLALALCAIDFAGLGRLFVNHLEGPETGLLMAAWFVASALNAALTWWFVSLRLVGLVPSTLAVPPETVLTWAPVVVAVMVWLLRVMLIGTINVAGRTLFQGGENDEENEGTEGAFSPGPMSDLLGRLRFSGAAQEHFHPDPVYAGGQPAARDPIVQSAGHVTRLDGRDQPAGADKHLLAAVPGGELRSRGAGRG